MQEKSQFKMLVPINAETALVARIEEHAHHARGAYSEGTIRVFRSNTAIFVAWCADNDRGQLPATAETVAAFIDDMAATRAVATIRRYVSSISRMHKAADILSPCDSELVRLEIVDLILIDFLMCRIKTCPVRQDLSASKDAGITDAAGQGQPCSTEFAIGCRIRLQNEALECSVERSRGFNVTSRGAGIVQVVCSHLEMETQ